MEKVIVEQMISFKRERRTWLQPSRSRQVETLRCQQLKINKILSAPNLLGHILLAVLLPREGWAEMDFAGRSFHAEDSGYFRARGCQHPWGKKTKHTSPRSRLLCVCGGQLWV